VLVGLKHNNCNNNKRSERGLFTQTNCTHSKGGNVTSAGWQVTLCDPYGMWVSLAVSLVANCYTLFTLFVYLTRCEEWEQRRQWNTDRKVTDGRYCMQYVNNSTGWRLIHTSDRPLAIAVIISSAHRDVAIRFLSSSTLAAYACGKHTTTTTAS